MFEYIPYELKVFWGVYIIIGILPVIAAYVSTYFIEKRRKERIKRKLEVLRQRKA